jgi:outer membrane protein
MKLKLALAVALLTATAAVQAHAAEDFQPKAKGTILLNVRVTDAISAANSPINTSAGVATGLNVKATDSVMPTIGLSYFVTDNVALELIAGSTQHTVKAVGPGTEVAVRDTWLLPPILSAQYHFLPKARFSPYVGAGVGYMAFYAGTNRNGFNLHLTNGFAPAVEGGFDVALSGRWSANVDVKKVFFKTDASVNAGALVSKVYLDPLVVSTGVGYKF